MICRQVLDLKFPRTAPAFEWQHEMSRYYHQHLLLLLEKACNELCGEGAVIQLDKVNIDLGVLRLKDIKAGVIPATIYPLLLEQLRKNIPAALRSSAQAESAMRLSVARQWLFYMQKGYLPWNTLKVDEYWYTQVLEAFATDFPAVTLLREQLLHHPHVLQRVVHDHNTSFLLQLTAILTASSQVDKLLPVFHELAILTAIAKGETPIVTTSPSSSGQTSSYSIPVVISHLLWQMAIKAAAAKKGTGITAQEIAQQYIRHFLLQTTTAKENISRFFADVATTAAKETIAILPVCTPLVQKAIDHAAETTEVLPAISTSDIVMDETGIPANGIFLINAGLVLLNPFLNPFFKKNGLLKNNKFVDIVAHEKALYLLHYLATGETETAEHALVVPKLLCNWPLGKNLAQEIILTPEECQEADDLLEVIIEHWEKLQHTSVDALRSGFLQRNGKVFTHNEQTYIQVEQQPLDILLDYLPWSISHIKMPWMEAILRVEWR